MINNIFFSSILWSINDESGERSAGHRKRTDQQPQGRIVSPRPSGLGSIQGALLQRERRAVWSHQSSPMNQSETEEP